MAQVFKASKKVPDEMVFCKKSKASSHLVKQRFLENCIEYGCHRCGIKEWLGQKLSLDLDHINGDTSDNRKENLRLLCPNCHSMTDTYKSKNKASVVKIPEENIIKIISECLSIRQVLLSVGLAPRGGNYTRVYRIMSKYNIKLKDGPNKKCVSCGKDISAGCKQCSRCNAIANRKVEWPTKEELEKMVLEMPILKIGKKYKVRDNTIRKWCKHYGINTKIYGRGYWQKKAAGKM